MNDVQEFKALVGQLSLKCLTSSPHPGPVCIGWARRPLIFTDGL